MLTYIGNLLTTIKFGASRQQKLIWVVGTAQVYIIIFIFLYIIFGHIAFHFVIFPILLSAIVFGTYGGLGTALFLIPLNAGVSYLLRERVADAINTREFIALHITFLLVGIIVGYLVDLQSRYYLALDTKQQIQKKLTIGQPDYENLAERTNSIITFLNKARYFEYASPHITNLTGYSPREIIDTHLSKIIQPNWRDWVERTLNTQIEKQQSSRQIEFPIRTKQGKMKWVNLVTDLLYEGQKLVKIQMVFQDISTRKETEALLREAEYQYQALFNQTNDGLLLLDFGGNILKINQRGAQIYGYSVEELIGRNLRQITSNSDHQDIEEKMRNLLAGNSVPVYTRYVLHKDGHNVPIEVNMSLVKDDQGVPIYIQSAVRDISQREEARQQLLETEYRFEALFSHSNFSVLLLGLNGTILNINKHSAQLHGYTTTELIGKNLRELHNELDRPILEEKLKDVLEKKHLPPYETITLHKDGSSIPMEINLSLVTDQKDNPLYIQSISRDIRERKEFEERLRYLANHDSLTQLPNRNLLNEHLTQAILKSSRNDTQLAVLFIDLDDFKSINDNFGHAIGDMVLQKLAIRMKENLRGVDILARISGDEFAIILERVNDAQNATIVAEKLLTSAQQPFQINEHQITTSLSIGISICPQHSNQADQLLIMADQAMYAAKKAGKNQYQIYPPNSPSA